MQNGNKRLAKQLTLALEKLPEGVYKKDVAAKANATPAALSQWAKGIRKISPDVAKPISKFLNEIKLAYSAARQEYGILSFKDDGDVKDDLFAATIDQKQQEQERLAVQQAAFISAAKPDKQKTAKDWENINAMDKEFPEEISSEMKLLITWCVYNHRDPMAVIKQINDEIGG